VNSLRVTGSVKDRTQNGTSSGPPATHRVMRLTWTGGIVRFRSGSLATGRPATYSNERSDARRVHACGLWGRLSGFRTVGRRPYDRSSPDDDARLVELQRTWPRERSRFLLTGASSWLTPSPKDRRDLGEPVSPFTQPYFAPETEPNAMGPQTPATHGKRRGGPARREFRGYRRPARRSSVRQGRRWSPL
jgi:hypothetical protein